MTASKAAHTQFFSPKLSAAATSTHDRAPLLSSSISVSTTKSLSPIAQGRELITLRKGNLSLAPRARLVRRALLVKKARFGPITRGQANGSLSRTVINKIIPQLAKIHALQAPFLVSGRSVNFSKEIHAYTSRLAARQRPALTAYKRESAFKEPFSLLNFF